MIPRSVKLSLALERLSSGFTADELLSVWRDSKSEISWLLDNDYPSEAATLARAYSLSFSRFKHVDEPTTRKVMVAFPVNSTCTMQLLGISDEIDAYLIQNKLRIDQLTQSDNHGFREILHWAVARKNVALITQVVKQVSRDLVLNHRGNSKAWREGCHGMIRSLVLTKADSVDLSGEIDVAIADVVIVAPEYRKDGKEMIDLARFGLRETFFKMISVGLFRQFQPKGFTEDEFKLVLDMLPPKPTAREWHWIQMAIAIPGLTEKILFDPSIDMPEYIEALRTTDFKLNNHGSHLNYSTMVMFITQLTPEHLNTPERRRRARQLVNAVCNEENPDKKDPEKLRAELKRMGFHECVQRMCDQTKASILEDELGL